MRVPKFVIASAVLMASCDNSDDWRSDYDFVWLGENVVVYGYGYSEDDVCGGSFAEIDGHTAMIEYELGIEDGAKYNFRWFSEPFWEALGEENPCYGYGACAPRDGAISRGLPHMHESTHMITHAVVDCPVLLDQGLADFYDNAMYEAGSEKLPVWEEDSIRDIIATGQHADGTSNQYIIALHFISFLVETYGAPSVLDLCKELDGVLEPTTQQWDKAVRSVHGITLEELFDEYDDYPKCNYTQMRAHLWACHSGVIDYTFWVPDGEYVFETGCDDPQATNFWRDKATVTRRIRLFTDATLRVSSNVIGTGGDAVHMIRECKRCSQDPTVGMEITDDPFDYETQVYPAGIYEVTVMFDQRTNVRLSIEAEEPPGGWP